MHQPILLSLKQLKRPVITLQLHSGNSHKYSNRTNHLPTLTREEEVQELRHKELTIEMVEDKIRNCSKGHPIWEDMDQMLEELILQIVKEAVISSIAKQYLTQLKSKPIKSNPNQVSTSKTKTWALSTEMIKQVDNQSESLGAKVGIEQDRLEWTTEEVLLKLTCKQEQHLIYSRIISPLRIAKLILVRPSNSLNKVLASILALMVLQICLRPSIFNSRWLLKTMPTEDQTATLDQAVNNLHLTRCNKTSRKRWSRGTKVQGITGDR